MKLASPEKNCALVLGLLAVWLCALYAFASENPKSGAPCPQWSVLFQQQMSPTTIPEELERILAYHKGNGWFAKFAEEKTVMILKRPLRSSGELVFLPDKGLYRKLMTPFEQELLITPESIHQRDQSGRTEKVALEKLPAAKAFVEAFLTVFSGSWKALHSHFRVYFSSENRHWQLGLTPKHKVMATLISCIVLTGDDEHLVTLWVQETNGDLTYDRFKEPRILPHEQWAEYQPHFEWAR
jgi:hypothetical protein